METFDLAHDITVFTVTATSFPEGVSEALETIHSKVPYSAGRKFFGISRPENGKGIVYKAAAKELIKGELSKQGLDKFVIPKGKYICINIRNYMQDLSAIGAAFEQLTHLDTIDPEGYCIEWYLDDTDVKCMIKLN